MGPQLSFRRTLKQINMAHARIFLLLAIFFAIKCAADALPVSEFPTAEERRLENALMESMEPAEALDEVMPYFIRPEQANHYPFLPFNTKAPGAIRKRFNYYGHGSPRLSRSSGLGDRVRRYGSVRLTR